MSLDQLKSRVRAIGAVYADREKRARRLFIEERSDFLKDQREIEFSIKTEISRHFKISYSDVSFCGSAQLGFSIHQDKLFEPAISDLDVACINMDLFQQAWTDALSTTHAFTDLTPFGAMDSKRIDLFKDQLLRRGMIRIDVMPLSDLSRSWSTFQGQLSRQYTGLFKAISVAIYMNEYAFCWKQDSVLQNLMR